MTLNKIDILRDNQDLKCLMLKIQLHDFPTADIHYVIREKSTSLYIQSNQVGLAKVPVEEHLDSSS